MNKQLFKNSVASIILGVGALIAPYSAFAATVSNGIDECAKELLLSYFPEPIVNETLKKFNIPSDKWDGIKKSLANKDKDVVKIVEQKASAMNPNPLKDPQQRQAAVKLFRETLLQVFTDAMKENGIQDESQYQAMLDDIQQQKAKKFAMCMEKQKRADKEESSNGAAGTSNTNSDQESDEDEDDDTDDEEDKNSDGANMNEPAVEKK